MNTTIKRYIISSAVTFLTAFLGTVALQLQAGAGAEVTSAFIIGVLSVSARAGLKAVIEWALNKWK